MMRDALSLRLLPIKRMSADTISPTELRQLAKALGCQTQKDLADTLGITQARVSQILSGKHPVKRGALLTLIRQLELQYRTHRKKRHA